MQLQIIHYDVFRRHARNYLEPAVIHKWNLEQKNLFRKLQEGGKVAVAGDMRADTPGTFLFRSNYILVWSLLIIYYVLHWTDKTSTTQQESGLV